MTTGFWPELPPGLPGALCRAGRALGRAGPGGGGRGRPWDVALVVDGGPTMEVWEETARAFVRVLRRTGVYGRVTTHRLPHGRSTDPAGLTRRGADRRLTLLLTDGAGARWRTHTVEPLLRRWGQAGPVAVIHVLPHAVWPATALRGWQVLLRAPSPGAPNHRLRWRARGLGPDGDGRPPATARTCRSRCWSCRRAGWTPGRRCCVRARPAGCR
ncbi:hypothetical protein ACE6JH_15085 [Streptomyces nigra]